MFGKKTRQFEADNRKLNWELKQLERTVRELKQDLEEIKVSRRKWRDKASNLRRERRHLVQQIKLQSQGTES